MASASLLSSLLRSHLDETIGFQDREEDKSVTIDGFYDDILKEERGVMWETALSIVLESIQSIQKVTSVRWLVVGSAALTLQGCRFEPRDLDILVPTAEDLRRCVDCLNDAEILRTKSDPPIVTEAYPGGFEWSKAQYELDGFLIEAVHIASGGGIPDDLDGGGIWEGGSIV
jgi:hypothetical protein